MKQRSHTPLATALVIALTLSACGGGGDDLPPAEPAPGTPVLSIDEFVGLWKRDAASDVCRAAFPYEIASHYRLRDIAVTKEASGSITANTTYLVYDDAACSLLRAHVAERFALNPGLTTVSGRSNVLASEPTMLGFTMGTHSGPMFVMAIEPDGRLSGMKNARLIADVAGGRLWITTSTSGMPLDAAGYPTAFDPTNNFVR